MSKLREKTAILLIALFMISTLAFTVNAGFLLDPAGNLFFNSEAKWITEDKQVGDYSVHINYETPMDGDDGCIIVPVNLPLSEIVSGPSNYWFKLITTDDPDHPDEDDFPNYGEVVLMIDADGDGVYTHGGNSPLSGGDDYLFGEWVYYDTGLAGDDIPIPSHEWILLNLNDAGLLFWDRYVGAQAPGDDLRQLSWFLNHVDDGGSGDERTPFESSEDGVDITGDMIVKYVMIQTYVGYEAYIDDVTMGGVTYEIEPNQVNLGANPFLYHIVATSNKQAWITPDEYTGVEYGQDRTFTMTPGAYWYVSGLTVDGGSETPATSYTFNLVDDVEEHTIHATFAPYTIGISVDPDFVEFGPVPVGGTAEATVTVTNTGDIPVDVKADITEPFFQRNLKLNDIPWDGNFGYRLGLVDDHPLVVNLDLTVPSRTETVSYAGTLVFEITPPQP